MVHIFSDSPEEDGFRSDLDSLICMFGEEMLELGVCGRKNSLSCNFPCNHWCVTPAEAGMPFLLLPFCG